MLIMNVWKRLIKYSMAGLVMAGLLFLAAGAQAAHEVSPSDISANVPTSTPTQWTEKLTVQWKGPALTEEGSFANGDLPQGYIYKWNNSSTPLSDAVFNLTTGLDRYVEPEETPYIASKQSADLTALDFGDLIYLHIKTSYLDLTAGPALSNDVVYGPFLIDNVAPKGTIRIVDVNGTEITSTSNSLIYLDLAASKDPKYVYLSEESTPPPANSWPDSPWRAFPVGDDIALSVNPTAGPKTLYAWFADSVGNISKTEDLATDSFTLLPPSSISPNKPTIDLASGGSQTFVVEGTSANYDWSITNHSPETQGETVAQFSGASTNTNSVTIQALAKGTFKLQAVLTGGSDTLTSEIITVILSTTTVDIPLSVGWNLISIPVQPANTAIATVLSGIAGKYTTVWGEFNPANSSWKSYNLPPLPSTLTTMVPNKGYWIKVTQACTLSVTGTAATKEANLLTGWNLIGFSGSATTSISTVMGGITGKYSTIWGEFNPANSSWKSYNLPPLPSTLSSMGLGKGYWIKATQDCTLSY